MFCCVVLRTRDRCHVMLAHTAAYSDLGNGRLADNNYVRSVRVGERDLEPFVERYKMALKELRVVLDRERWRELDVLDAIEPLPHGEGGSAGLQVKSSNVELMRSAMRKRVQGAYGL